MDYNKVLEKVGKFGKYQKVFLLVVSICSMFNATTSAVLNFAFGEHGHRCRAPYHDDHYTHTETILVNTSNGIEQYNVTERHIQINGSIRSCDSWVYDKSIFTATIISKFDIVCDQKFYRAHFLLVHYIGMLVGSLASGVFSDIFGRKPVMFVAVLMIIVSMGTRPFIDNLMLVTVLEFFNGCGSIVAYISPFILLTEMVGPTKRLLASFCVYMMYCVGNYVVLILAYVFRDWRHMFWAISILIGVYSLALSFISESPRWLITRGRTKEAVGILQKISKFNGKNVNISTDDLKICETNSASFGDFIKEIIKSKTLMLRLAVISFNWCAINMTYYAISMNIAKFSGDIFVNFSGSALAEILATLVGGYLTDKLGRKRFLFSTMVLSGVTCICTIFTVTSKLVNNSLAMIGKFFSTVNFFVVYIYTVELFPTVLRASVLGVASTTGRFGSITSAYIGELGSVIPTKFGIALPLTILGSFALVAGLLALTLPETTNTFLPDSVEDAKVITLISEECETNILEMQSVTEKMCVSNGFGSSGMVPSI